MKRKRNQIIDMSLGLMGMAIVLGAVVLSPGISLQMQLLIVIVGLLFIEAGVWGLAARVMPNQRRFTRLREEGDRMLVMIRQLNNAALARDQGLEDGTRFQATLEEMHATVNLMAELAALEDGQQLEQSLDVIDRRDPKRLQGETTDFVASP